MLEHSEGAFPVLLMRGEVTFMRGQDVMIQPLVISPAILKRCTPSCMWAAFMKKMTNGMWEWAGCAEVGP